MMTRMMIHYEGGAHELTSEHPKALRDAHRLIRQLAAGDTMDRQIPVFTNDGLVPIPLDTIDRIEVDWSR